MNKAVLDASALIALLTEEPGHTIVEKYLENSIISTVNLSEVMTSLNKLGMSPDHTYQHCCSLIKEIIPFDETQAVTTANLIKLTKPHGLSLGDRACLSLASLYHLPAITADKQWKQVKLPVKIIFIR